MPSHYFNSLTLTGILFFFFFFLLFCFPATPPLSSCVYGTEDKNQESPFHLKNKCDGGGGQLKLNSRNPGRNVFTTSSQEVTNPSTYMSSRPWGSRRRGCRRRRRPLLLFRYELQLLNTLRNPWLDLGGSVAASGAPFSGGLITPGSLQATPSITYLLLFLFETEKRDASVRQHLIRGLHCILLCKPCKSFFILAHHTSIQHLKGRYT